MRNTVEYDESQPVILFDGVCNLCNGSINLLLKIDKHNILYFSQLQSDYSRDSLKTLGYDIKEIQSFVLLMGNRVYFKSEAFIKILELLGYPWKFFIFLKYIPGKLRNLVYDFIAANRYKWFGRKDVCMIPDKKNVNKFL